MKFLTYLSEILPHIKKSLNSILTKYKEYIFLENFFNIILGLYKIIIKFLTNTIGILHLELKNCN